MEKDRWIWRFLDDISLFLKEAHNRWKASTPRFIKVLGNISLVLGFIGGIPLLLDQTGIILSPRWADNLAKIVAFSGFVGKIITNFTFSSGDKVSLPFTEKKQEEKLKENIMENNILTQEQEAKLIDEHLDNFPERVHASSPHSGTVLAPGVDICGIVAKAKPILPFVAKYLLFWKPKWQGALNDVIALLDVLCPTKEEA